MGWHPAQALIFLHRVFNPCGLAFAALDFGVRARALLQQSPDARTHSYVTKRVIGGLTSMKSRASESERLVEWAFREFNDYKLFKAGDKVDDAEIWLGSEPKVGMTTGGAAPQAVARWGRTEWVLGWTVSRSAWMTSLQDTAAH